MIDRVCLGQTVSEATSQWIGDACHGLRVGYVAAAHCVFAKPGLDCVSARRPAFQRIPCWGFGLRCFTYKGEEGSGEGGIFPKSKSIGSSNACELLLCEH